MGDYKGIRKTFTYDGKRYEVRGKTEREAEAAKQKKLIELGSVGNINSTMTVKEWADQWLEIYRKDKDNKTIDTKLRLYIIPRIGKMKLSDVKNVHLQKILTEQSGMSESHVKKVKQTICSLFKRAYKSRLIPFDPSEDLEMPPAVTGTHRALTPEEKKKVKDTCETHKHGLWVKFMYHTGVRPGESCALLKSDIDFENETVTISKAKSYLTGEVKDPKTKAGNRTIPIPHELLQELKEYTKDMLPTAYLFPDAQGNMATSSVLASRWRYFSRTAGFEGDLDIYDLRHNYCTELCRKGIPMKTAQYLMGHSSIRITAEIYAHVQQEDLEIAKAIINGAANA